MTKKKNENKCHQKIRRKIKRWALVKGPSWKNKLPSEKIGNKKEFSQFGETITELSKEIPILATYDVLVVGGGPAGISADLS